MQSNLPSWQQFFLRFHFHSPTYFISLMVHNKWNIVRWMQIHYANTQDMRHCHRHQSRTWFSTWKAFTSAQITCATTKSVRFTSITWATSRLVPIAVRCLGMRQNFNCRTRRATWLSLVSNLTNFLKISITWRCLNRTSPQHKISYCNWKHQMNVWWSN